MLTWAQAENFIAVLRGKEYDAGLLICQEAVLKGNIEMEDASLGRFWVKASNETWEKHQASQRRQEVAKKL